jgi:hypothetical protein
MSIASSLFQLYVRDPAYFQRMVEFFLHGRFKAVRPFLEGKEREEVFFTVEGELVDVRNNRRRFATFTDWYNAGFGTSCAMNDTDIFNKIWVTRRVTLMDILKTVTAKEREEFLDVKYLSSIAYGYIQRRMRVKFIAVGSGGSGGSGGDKKHAVTVEWQGRKYYVSHINTTTDMGFSVVRFLHTICGEESAIRGLYCIMEDGSKILLNEEVEEVEKVVVEKTALLPTPNTPTIPNTELEDLKKEVADLKAQLQLLHTDVRILSPLQIADREKFTKEIEELRAQNQTLTMHYQNLAAITGAVLQRLGPVVAPVGYSGHGGYVYQ